jgi:myo-inositol-1(or 4)-monophosphatase
MDKELIRWLCESLALHIRELVRPRLGKASSRKVERRGSSGDSTFSIDEAAESLVQEYLRDYPQVAYYSEDQGLVAGPDARLVLIIDPIDGTRPAAAGLEACCVSVAAAAYHPELLPSPTMRDVVFGYVCEIKGDGVFYAFKGEGAHHLENEMEQEIERISHREISTLFWTIGFRGRPAIPLAIVLEELIDRSSVDGGMFDLGSATYGITRLLTGQLHAYVDVGDRMRRDVPEVVEDFRRVGHGHVLNNSSYDLAAANLIAKEAGLVVTDAYGRPDDHYPLFGKETENQLSCVVSVDEHLHEEIIRLVDEGIERLKRFYASR